MIVFLFIYFKIMKYSIRAFLVNAVLAVFIYFVSWLIFISLFKFSAFSFFTVSISALLAIILSTLIVISVLYSEPYNGARIYKQYKNEISEKFSQENFDLKQFLTKLSAHLAENSFCDDTFKNLITKYLPNSTSNIKKKYENIEWDLIVFFKKFPAILCSRVLSGNDDSIEVTTKNCIDNILENENKAASIIYFFIFCYFSEYNENNLIRKYVKEIMDKYFFVDSECVHNTKDYLVFSTDDLKRLNKLLGLKNEVVIKSSDESSGGLSGLHMFLDVLKKSDIKTTNDDVERDRDSNETCQSNVPLLGAIMS